LSELREGDVAAPIGCLGSEWYPWYIMDTPENNRFVAEVYKRCGLYPDGGGYLYGNGILFLKAAIEKAGSADVEKVVDALEGITITPFGFADITMRACDHQDMLPIYSGVIGWDPTGKYPFPILLPETIRTADDPADWYYTCEKAVAGRE